MYYISVLDDEITPTPSSSSSLFRPTSSSLFRPTSLRLQSTRSRLRFVFVSSSFRLLFVFVSSPRALFGAPCSFVFHPPSLEVGPRRSPRAFLRPVAFRWILNPPLHRSDAFDDASLQVGVEPRSVPAREHHLHPHEQGRQDEGLEERVQERGASSFEDDVSRVNLSDPANACTASA